MKIILTGGAGFIGSHIAELYLQEGHDILIVDNLSNGKEENIPKGAKFEKINIGDSRIFELFNKFKPDILNHHAAQINLRFSVEYPVKDANINILGMVNLLDAFRKSGGKKVIFASSGGAIYEQDNSNIPTDENGKEKPISPYGTAKLTGEHYLYNFYHFYGINYIALRYANVYGPRQDPTGEAGVVSIFISKLLNNKQATIFGKGNHTRDYVFVKDVAQANLKSLYSDYRGYINIGTAKETTVNNLFSLIASNFENYKSPIHGDEVRELSRSALKYDLAKKILDWEPKVNLSDGLKETVEFFSN